MNLTRRAAVIRMATLMGASVVGPRLLAAALDGGGSHGFSAADLALLDEVGDTIIPPTDVPGAKAVGIGAFIAMMVHDCSEPPDQAAFRAGLARLEADFRARHGVGFAAGTPADRTAFLNALDAEARAHRGPPAHPFRMMKELTILGYFTSEIGATQALRFEEVPGRYDGDAPWQPGDRAWAT